MERLVTRFKFADPPRSGTVQPEGRRPGAQAVELESEAASRAGPESEPTSGPATRADRAGGHVVYQPWQAAPFQVLNSESRVPTTFDHRDI